MLRRYALIAVLLVLSGCAVLGPAPDPLSPGQRRDLVLEALGQVGRPYRYGGTTPDGFDCSGLVQYVYRQIGVSLPRSSREQRAAASEIRMRDAQPGDLLFYSFSGRGIDHVAIYLGDRQAVHAPASGRAVIVASVDLEYWQDRYVAAARVRR